MMKKGKVLLSLAAALLLPASVFAVSGKTMYHYYAYEAAFWNKSMPVNADNYYKLGLNSLVGLPFDTLVFAPVFDFGSMAALLKSAEYPTHQPNAESRWMSNYRNAMPELAKAGLDPIALTVKWCRQNKREAVVALPVNFTSCHNGKPTPKQPSNSWGCYLFSPYKAKNPAMMMNAEGKTPTPFAPAIAIDYTDPAVVEKFKSIAVEIAGKYDIDGIMVDFTMEPTLFKSVGAGGTAAPKEVEMISKMMRDIKEACKAASGRLGHPVALSARVPDSIGYCKDIGIDLQGWLDTKLLDYVVLGGYFQLNRWNVVGDVANKAGVPYYASFMHSGLTVFNDSGYSGDDERMPRNSREVCAARMTDAMLCKAAGCMFTMGTHWQVAFGNHVVMPYDAKAIRLHNKRYFVSNTNDGIAGRFLKEGTKYRTLQSLVSNEDLAKGIAKHTVFVWDDIEALKRDGVAMKITLITEVNIPSGMDTIVTMNGKELKPFKKRAGTQLYDVPLNLIKQGGNEVTVRSKGKSKRGGTALLGNIAVEVTFPKKEGSK